MVKDNEYSSQKEFSLDEGGSSAVLSLNGELTILQSNWLKTVLVESLAAADGLILNLEKVTDFDLATVQLFYSLANSAQEIGKDLLLSGDCPSVFKAVVENAGYSDLKWLCFR